MYLFGIACDMANNFIESAAVIVDAYLVSGKQGGPVIYQNSTWRTARRKHVR